VDGLTKVRVPYFQVGEFALVALPAGKVRQVHNFDSHRCPFHVEKPHAWMLLPVVVNGSYTAKGSGAVDRIVPASL